MKSTFTKNPESLAIFGRYVRKLRKEATMSQETLAHKAGIDRSYLGGIERGEHNVALLNIIKIATALNVPPSFLLQPLDSEITL